MENTIYEISFYYNTYICGSCDERRSGVIYVVDRERASNIVHRLQKSVDVWCDSIVVTDGFTGECIYPTIG